MPRGLADQPAPARMIYLDPCRSCIAIPSANQFLWQLL
jgi:hypothetical protein